jgi:hypothetical protein
LRRKRVTEIPVIIPVIKGWGIYLIRDPNLNTPIKISMQAAISVARARPSYPYFCIIP